MCCPGSFQWGHLKSLPRTLIYIFCSDPPWKSGDPCLDSSGDRFCPWRETCAGGAPLSLEEHAEEPQDPASSSGSSNGSLHLSPFNVQELELDC